MKVLKLIILIITCSLSTNLFAITVPGPLVDTAWLAKNSGKVVILDARKDIKSFTRKPVFKKDKKTGKLILVKVGGHIPGASLVNYNKVRTNKNIDGNKVQKMLPGKKYFETIIQDAGANKDSAIVIVTKGESLGDVTIATRMYWQLKYYGHTNMAILNGGMAEWLTKSRKISIKAEKASRGDWVGSKEDKSILATTKDAVAATKDKNVQLVDTRDLNLYLGTYKKSYVYAKGHIPGAKLLPVELLTRPKSPARLNSANDFKTFAQAFNINTDKPVITYCNSGHLASGAWFVMSELLGNKQTKLYDGSMHQWTLEKQPVTAMKME
ncbi:MAG: sulfurtransferase [Gammaproteobacteria bacterium]|nr:sulfurtransferase [Gammaproteobacteria bacterium]